MNVKSDGSEFSTVIWKRNWRRAVWLAAVLRMTPFVRMVGLNGSMAAGNFRSESDIDLYVVIADRHLYLGRLLTMAVVQLSGRRIRPGKEAGSFCANRFAIASFTEITPHDLYHARVFHNLIPLYAAPGVYGSFVSANVWMEEQGYPVRRHAPVLSYSLRSRLVQRWGEWLLGAAWIERRASQWQRSRVARDPRTTARGSRVVVSDRELRFHVVKNG